MTVVGFLVGGSLVFVAAAVWSGFLMRRFAERLSRERMKSRTACTLLGDYRHG